MNRFHKTPGRSALALALATLVCSAHSETVIGTDLSSAAGADPDINALYSGNRGNGGDQSLQFGDIVEGSDDNDLLVGALGIDVLFGKGGNDVLIGGTEDFNPFNRDRAFGGAGDDVFIWAPGDGNDFFDGGAGQDVLMIGLLGEQYDANGSAEGAPFFAVSPPGSVGSQDFDGVFVDEAATGLPVVEVANGPGFCEVVAADGEGAPSEELARLGLDHLVRFSLRGPADAFDAAVAADPWVDTDELDTGLRVAVHLKNTEFLVCAARSENRTVVLDLTTSPPTEVSTAILPSDAYYMIRP